MPPEDTGTDMSEMRSEVDALSLDASEGMSEMQDESLGYTEEEPEPEKARYRVTMGDYGCVENDLLFEEYFADYPTAYAVYSDLCDSDDFINHHDRQSVMVMLWKSYRGLSQIFWEVIKRSVVYKDAE